MQPEKQMSTIELVLRERLAHELENSIKQGMYIVELEKKIKEQEEQLNLQQEQLKDYEALMDSETK